MVNHRNKIFNNNQNLNYNYTLYWKSVTTIQIWIDSTGGHMEDNYSVCTFLLLFFCVTHTYTLHMRVRVLFLIN